MGGSERAFKRDALCYEASDTRFLTWLNGLAINLDAMKLFGGAISAGASLLTKTAFQALDV